MGVDLVIFPAWPSKDITRPVLAFERLAFQREYSLFEQIEGFREHGRGFVFPQRLGVSVLVYGDEGIKDCSSDPYGSPITFMFARDFAKLRSESSRNKAILAFCASLEPDWPIILWWN